MEARSVWCPRSRSVEDTKPKPRPNFPFRTSSLISARIQGSLQRKGMFSGVYRMIHSCHSSMLDAQLSFCDGSVDVTAGDVLLCRAEARGKVAV